MKTSYKIIIFDHATLIKGRFMQFKNSYYLIINSLMVFFSCNAHSSAEQIADLLRKKNEKMYTISAAGQKIINENHERIVKKEKKLFWNGNFLMPAAKKS